MKTLIRAVCGLIVCALPAFADVVPGTPITQPSQKNLLVDPGMEHLIGVPANDAWSYYSADHFAVDKEVFHSGKQSLRLDAKDSSKSYGAYSGAGASAGPVDFVEFGAWVKADPALAEGAWVRLYAQITVKGGKLIENTIMVKGGGTEWRFAGNRVPVGGVPVERAVFYVIADNCAGSIWIDDACLGYAPAKKQAAKPVAPGEGLVAHYTFAEGEGAVLKDHSGNGHDGTIHGAKWVKSAQRTALSFHEGDYVDLGADPVFNLPGERTIAVWAKLQTPSCPDPTTNWVIFNGGDHMIFSGRPRHAEGKVLPGWYGTGEKDALFHSLICTVTTAFWDAYLRDDAQAKQWLTGGGCAATLGENATFEMKVK